MRTTLAFDDDIFLALREAAARERRSLGDMASELIRVGLRSMGSAPGPTAPLQGKYSLLPARDQIVTTEHVRTLMDQEGL